MPNKLHESIAAGARGIATLLFIAAVALAAANPGFLR